jgi:hypothetical protein
MIKHEFTVWVKSLPPNWVTFEKPLWVAEDVTYSAFNEVQKKVESELLRMCGNMMWVPPNQRVVPSLGSEGSAVIHIKWTCTQNGRSPARPKHVIAAEKAARAVRTQAKRAQRAEWEAKAKAEQLKREANLRNRVKQQVDHAFAQGKHGTEPAAKFITCQHCDAPAALLVLSQMPARGTAVLDEDLIVGTECATHNYRPYRGSGNPKISCDRLEFFYDGIRQIAIKP